MLKIRPKQIDSFDQRWSKEQKNRIFLTVFEKRQGLLASLDAKDVNQMLENQVKELKMVGFEDENDIIEAILQILDASSAPEPDTQSVFVSKVLSNTNASVSSRLQFIELQKR